jgi:dihydroflavonol-4-reductase
MRVLVTGGTGFVGSHSVAALVDAGHEVRLLVRSPDRVAPALEPLNVAEPELVVGDVTDSASVDSAMRGCEGLLHCASVYSLDPRDAELIRSTTVRGTEIVIQAARKHHLDPIVHVSSYVALMPSSSVLGADSPAGTAPALYPRSKAESDLVARRHQDEGAPVVISYPGAVIGPHDPHFTESNRLMASILRNRVPFAIRGVMPIADVRYVAAAHAATMEAGRGPRRYMLGGHSMPWKGIFAAFRRLTGRRIPTVPVPRFLALAVGRAGNGMQRIAPWRLPVSFDGTWIVLNGTATDDSRAHEELKVELRRVDQTLTDMILWMVEAGYLRRSAAGHLMS